MRRRVSALLAVGVIALLAATGAGASDLARAHDASGVLYEVVPGTLEALFPRNGASSATGSFPALALDMTQPGGARERLLVPGTEASALDLDPTLIIDPQSSSLFLLWRSRTATGRSSLWLATLIDGIWHETTRIGSKELNLDGPPAVTLLRESEHRTVLHLLWSEAESTGAARSYYSPLVLFRGRYIGWSPILTLGSLDLHDAGGSALPENLSIFGAPRLRRGVDDGSAIIAFASPSTSHLVSARSRILPPALITLADEARNHLVGVGVRRQKTALAAEVRSFLNQLDVQLHDATRSYLARSAYVFIRAYANDFDSLEVLGNALRWHLIAEGATLLGQAFTAVPTHCGILAVGPGAMRQALPTAHYMEICVISDLGLPALGFGSTNIHVSRDGTKAVLTREENGAIYFRQSLGDAWSDERRLPLGAGQDPQTAIDTLVDSL